MRYRAWHITKQGGMAWAVVEAIDLLQAKQFAKEKYGDNLRAVKEIQPPPQVVPPKKHSESR